MLNLRHNRRLNELDFVRAERLMPTEGTSRSFFPLRMALPCNAGGTAALPALVAAVPVRSYVGRSRFVLAPLSLTLDQLLFLITAALLCFGLIMVQSADSRIRGGQDNWLATVFRNKNAIHASLALL